MSDFTHRNHVSKERMGLITCLITEIIQDLVKINGEGFNLRVSATTGPFMFMKLVVDNTLCSIQTKLSHISHCVEGKTNFETAQEIIMEKAKQRNCKDIESFLNHLSQERNAALYAPTSNTEMRFFKTENEFEDVLIKVVISCVIAHDIVSLPVMTEGVSAALCALNIKNKDA